MAKKIATKSDKLSNIKIHWAPADFFGAGTGQIQVPKYRFPSMGPGSQVRVPYTVC